MAKKFISQRCHLCGEMILTKDDSGEEHVPPKQFFPSALRSLLSPNLIKVPAHKSCNSSFQKDEDYFISTLGPLTEKATVHEYIKADLQSKFTDVKRHGLLHGILKEFNSRFWLPNDQIIKTSDSMRIFRVVWKIVRGLHFREYNTVLDEAILPRVGIYQGFNIDPIPDIYKFAFNDTDLIGEYQAIFCYRHNMFSFTKNRQTWECWALMFWDSILAFVVFSKN